MASNDQTKENTRTRTLNVGALVKKAWGKEWSKADVAYVFSNGRKFLSTDRDESGVYRRD